MGRGRLKPRLSNSTASVPSTMASSTRCAARRCGGDAASATTSAAAPATYSSEALKASVASISQGGAPGPRLSDRKRVWSRAFMMAKAQCGAQCSGRGLGAPEAYAVR